MKKSDQSLNKALTRGSIRRLFTVPMIICLVIFALDFISSVFTDMYYIELYDPSCSYTLIDTLREEAICMNKASYEPYYCLSASITNTSPFIFGVILAALQFNFLLSKKSCYTQLSFAFDRNRLFTIRTLIPLSIPSAIIILTNIVAFILNAVYLGVTVNLFAGVALSILTSLLSLLTGYTATVAGHLFTARRIEAYIFTLSLLSIGSTISAMLSFILPETLYGYANEFMYFSTLSEEYVSTDLSYSIDSFPINGPTYFALPIILNIVVLLILSGVLILFKQYFVKRYKVEQSGVRGKSRVALVISCIVPALYFVHAFSLFSSYTYYDVSFTTMFVISIIASAILCLIICLITTFSPKKLLWGAVAAGSTIIIHLLVLVIGLTGGFGYTTRIPDKDKIASVEISLPFNEMAYGYNIYNDNQFFYNSTQYPPDTITLTTEKDIDTAIDIHKTLIENREEETGVPVVIYYWLEDGTMVERMYENVSVAATEKMFGLWETDQNRMNLRTLLNQTTKEDEAKIKELAIEQNEETIIGYSETFGDSFRPDYYYFSGVPTSLSTFTNTYLISKDSSVTILEFVSDSEISANYTEEVILEIMGAIYKDASSLSADEWFNSEKNLGALAFHSNISNTSTDINYNSYDAVFYINSNMSNTVSVLEKYGYLKYFDCKKEIEKAHTIGVDEVSAWMQAYYDEYDKSANHGVYFSQMNSDIEEYLASGCGYLSSSDVYSDEYYDDEYYFEEDKYYTDIYTEYYDVELNPQELHNKKEIKALLNKSHLAHKITGEGDKFLVIKYMDGTCSMLLIPG